MDALVNALYAIPVLGVLFQFVGYIIDVLPSTAPTVLALATPIALGALCGIMNERSGIVNIGIEGMMLMSAFVGFITALIVQGEVTPDPGDPFGVTPALIAGVVGAVLAGMAISALHAWL